MNSIIQFYFDLCRFVVVSFAHLAYGSSIDCEKITSFRNIPRYSCKIVNLTAIENTQQLAIPAMPPTVNVESVNSISIESAPRAWKINRIPNEVFTKFPILRTLEINSAIEKVAPEDFQNASPELRRLYLSRNEITTIDDFAFANLSTLEDLSMENNKLTTIKRNTFSSLVELTALDLDDNVIDTIEDGAFRLPKLETLSLRYNKITLLSDAFFTDVISIKVLRLDSNNLENVNLIKYTKLPKLKELSLAHTNTRLDNVIIDSESSLEVKTLDMSGNHLNNLTALQALRVFPSLQILDLSSNEFEKFELDEQFLKTNWPELRRLNLWELKDQNECQQHKINFYKSRRINVFC